MVALVWIFLAMAIGALGVLGDYFIKRASEAGTLLSLTFLSGFVIYALTAIGWFFAMQHIKLASVGVFYSISSILLLALVGLIFFRESLGPAEMVGIALAIGAVVLLAKFS